MDKPVADGHVEVQQGDAITVGHQGPQVGIVMDEADVPAAAPADGLPPIAKNDVFDAYGFLFVGLAQCST